MFKTHLNFEDHFQELRSKEAAINDYRQIIVNTKCLRETVRWIFVVLIGSEVYSIVTYLLSENSEFFFVPRCVMLINSPSGKFCCIGDLFMFPCKECNKGAHFHMIFHVLIFSSNVPLSVLFFFLQKRVLHNQQIIKLSN